MSSTGVADGAVGADVVPEEAEVVEVVVTMAPKAVVTLHSQSTA
jgi:hypothetical protein